jgi:protein phosphatase
VQKLVEAGELTAEEAETSERRNIILQALGPDPRVKVDLTAQRVRRGDLLVVCSDGLSGQVRPDVIARTAAAEPDPFALCQRLIDLANASGGPDNITVIAARFDGDGLAEPDGADPVGHQVFRFSGRRDTIAVGDDTPTPPMGVRTVTPDAPIASVADPATPVGYTSGPRPAVRPPASAAPAATPRRRDATPVYLAIAIIGVLLVAFLAWTWRR